MKTITQSNPLINFHLFLSFDECWLYMKVLYIFLCFHLQIYTDVNRAIHLKVKFPVRAFFTKQLFGYWIYDADSLGIDTKFHNFIQRFSDFYYLYENLSFGIDKKHTERSNAKVWHHKKNQPRISKYIIRKFEMSFCVLGRELKNFLWFNAPMHHVLSTIWNKNRVWTLLTHYSCLHN